MNRSRRCDLVSGAAGVVAVALDDAAGQRREQEMLRRPLLLVADHGAAEPARGDTVTVERDIEGHDPGPGAHETSVYRPDRPIAFTTWSRG